MFLGLVKADLVYVSPKAAIGESTLSLSWVFIHYLSFVILIKANHSSSHKCEFPKDTYQELPSSFFLGRCLSCKIQHSIRVMGL